MNEATYREEQKPRAKAFLLMLLQDAVRNAFVGAADSLPPAARTEFVIAMVGNPLYRELSNCYDNSDQLQPLTVEITDQLIGTVDLLSTLTIGELSAAGYRAAFAKATTHPTE